MVQEVIAPPARLPDVSLAGVQEISERQHEPAWLRERRAEAWRIYEAMDLPDPGDEQWRRTDVRGLPLEGVRPAAAPARRASVDGLPSMLPHVPERREEAAGRIVQLDGGVVHAELREDLRAQGVVLTDLHTAARDHGDLLREHLSQSVPADEWKYVALNAAAWSGGVLLFVPKDVVIDAPFEFAASLSAGGLALFPRAVIVAERYSRVKIVDETASAGNGAPSFVSGVVEIYAGEGASLEYYPVNRWGRNVYNFTTVRARLGRDARFAAAAVGLGSKLTKARIDVVMPESGARTELLGLTFGEGDQHFDYNTLQDHAGKHTASDLLFKSALTDSASLVWYGITRIQHSAGGSEANQTSRNLLLSDHAKAAPIPILEIQAYDVSKCSHGATAGPVDENELFYLQSRAIPRETAEQMLVEGFFVDVIGRIPDVRLRERAMDAVLAKMGGRRTSLTFEEMMSA